jgi:hypothetical protein
MQKHRTGMALLCTLFILTAFVWAQAVRKAGLWEMTTNMTWQQSPMPGMNMSHGDRTTQVCLTQEMIDRYGAPVPQSNKDCTITNVSLHTTGMTAEMVCTGPMNGKATMQSSWSDGNVAKGTVHFVGTMQMGPHSGPIEWTVNSTSVYKGPDCGSVKPLPMPAK